MNLFLLFALAQADDFPEGRLRLRDCRSDLPASAEVQHRPASSLVRRATEPPTGPMTASGLAGARLRDPGRVPSLLGAVQHLLTSGVDRSEQVLDLVQEFYLQGLAFHGALGSATDDDGPRRAADAGQVARVLRNAVRMAEGVRAGELDQLSLERPGRVEPTDLVSDWLADEALLVRLHRGLPRITERVVPNPAQPTAELAASGPGLELRVLNCSLRPVPIWGEAWVLDGGLPEVLRFRLEVPPRSARSAVIPSSGSGEVRLTWGSARQDLDVSLGDALDLVAR